MHVGSVKNSGQLTQALKAEALRLGFTLVGVTLPDPPPHGQVFLDWLDRGFHGEMAYLDTERSRLRRLEPRQILPECQSVLVVGLPYMPAGKAGDPVLSGIGRVAAYAWKDDYHEQIPPRLQSLVHFLEDQLGRPVPNRWYTDTGPILERDMAQRAGLGWVGKNTCLIHPDHGSYFFLAEILLGVQLEADSAFQADRCGSCTRCLEACPTGCILPNRTIDARHCISYLTIELKGSIPLELRPQVGDWVFGCDICQQVCPWNLRFASSDTVDEVFIPSGEVVSLDLVDALGLSAQDFNQRFKGSPIKRAKRRGLLRNVAVVLGNSADSAAVPALGKTLLEEFEPLVRGHAAWALGRLGGVEARRLLEQALIQECDEDVRREISQALDGGR